MGDSAIINQGETLGVKAYWGRPHWGPPVMQFPYLQTFPVATAFNASLSTHVAHFNIINEHKLSWIVGVFIVESSSCAQNVHF